ncbi:hypothetical protein [Paucimonas lemoignei]|uniref:hypothetical protein n=1 Tax=Paucimonas lemoignei TaxID=29443 RepID=UPI00104A62A3|nr:hypothetical protein [Paucimonas lemoignei]
MEKIAGLMPIICAGMNLVELDRKPDPQMGREEYAAKQRGQVHIAHANRKACSRCGNGLAGSGRECGERMMQESIARAGREKDAASGIIV